MLLALVGGTCMGAYLMWEFFPGQPFLQVWAPRHSFHGLFHGVSATQKFCRYGAIEQLLHVGGPPCTASCVVSRCMHCRSMMCHTAMCADAGVWRDSSGGTVPGARAAAKSGLHHLAALPGSCLGPFAACDLLCPGVQSLTLTTCQLCLHASIGKCTSVKIADRVQKMLL